AALRTDAEAPPVLARAVVAYSAKIALRGKSEPGATMSISVGGRRTPSVRVDDAGTFSVPIEVRPGERYAIGEVRDAIGNRSRARIDLFLPEIRRFHAFVFPEVVAAGQDAWLFVTSLSVSGVRERKSPPRVAAARGRLGPGQALDGGWTRHRYQAPKTIGEGPDVVTLRDARSSNTVAIELTAGPVARIAARSERVPFNRDGIIEVVAFDGYGNSVELSKVTVESETGVPRESNTPVVLPAPGREQRERYRVSAGSGITSVEVLWHRPLPVDLRLNWKDTGRIVLRTGDPQVLDRVLWSAVGLKMVRRERVGNHVEVVVDEVQPDARLVVRDPETGVSAWIGAR
ncbi:MAG: hypothetical protein AAF658_08425, partial [Myxococcota bacterium]